MAMLLLSKRFLLVALLLFCFIFMTAKGFGVNDIYTKKTSICLHPTTSVFGKVDLWHARSLKVSDDIGVDKGQTSEMFKPNNNEVAHNSSDSVDTMDYTPAKKNPPIHN
ncbi:hypothetical protein Lal_00049899 [Lupinus albus]|nr:hypothetical protein Lal_00049899 [Lupinus albus]